MKKTFAALLLALAVFTSNAFAEDKEVFVIGEAGFGPMIQVNSSCEPLAVYPKGNNCFFVIGPVKEGSVFKRAPFVNKKEVTFSYRSVIFIDSESLLQSDVALTVKPNERGVFLFYYNTDLYDPDSDFAKEMRETRAGRKRVRKMLKAAVKQYKGTKWESVLNAEMEAWK